MTQIEQPGPGLAARWRERDAAHVATCYSRYSDLVVERAQGAHLHTVDGRDVLDFGCGIGVTNLGHGHPAVQAAVHAQVDRVLHTSVTAHTLPMIEAAEEIAAVAPGGLESVFLCNSGAEAVEAAIKLARKATRRSDVIAFLGAFHGRTYGALSLTASKAKYHAGMGPLLPGVHHVPYPGEGEGESAVAEIERLLATTVDPGDVAAVVVEPVLGEGGYVVPPDGFLPGLRRLCDRHGILLVADEVQTGFARTGRFFAVEHTGTQPDIMCLAKGLGNGMPVAAMVATREVMSAWHPGDHGTTYGGNPVACSAAVAVIRTIRSEGLVERSARLGDAVLERARGWPAIAPRLSDVRGLGLMIGLEFTTAEGAPDPELVARIREESLRHGLLLLSCGSDDNVIRLIPPLTIPEAELDQGLEILELALGSCAGGNGGVPGR
ncbi:MAG TPA: aminotransferase class III-fold pyridoxal phosphate-dependent enzyme [Candidatus Dormibacteraeota bacterium]